MFLRFVFKRRFVSSMFAAHLGGCVRYLGVCLQVFRSFAVCFSLVFSRFLSKNKTEQVLHFCLFDRGSARHAASPACRSHGGP